ncbi:CDP-diacylglycerol--glycerol-3-phosphate 3-phosphatidyltransferase [Oecophyllibacter saccharovorans]|uniref:CDP-diacylglycerol--glycerol-3-phosphate 3-phosphatidyltransferase n=1 Tax=Oecophyllibacter saccharovorans TaxID=2558360 RepID=UPI0011716735|nr:CDP-diacylglycerol--glycerol-3-phosphate 3-phosphatidyltransferase [Oecophyllibacter saccharovorans]TPW34609.1 CDP-diacylglycerol--glycerol-3-phosphate 3-phosphatidyltransferase [Oecophyllibacter saccharovorans]
MLTDLPNLLTLFRIASIPVLLLLLACHTGATDVAAFCIYVLACLTDYFDGALARRRCQHSELGRMMDPIADKLLVGALLMDLAGLGRLPCFSLYAAIAIMLREILVSGLREYMASHGAKLPSTRLAKWKTALQMIALGFLVLGAQGAAVFNVSGNFVEKTGAGLLWLSVIPTLVSGWGYLREAFIRMKG